MARKSLKATPASAARSSSKRAAPDKPTPTRQSKRAKATPAKSSYFEHDSDGSDQEVAPASSEEEGGSNASDFEDAESKDASSESEPEIESSEEEAKPKKGTPRGRAAQRSTLPMHKKQANEKELWKPGAKLTPGTQLIIKKPKAREAGDTPYADDTIHPNTMLFLSDLAANNDRVWLKSTSPYPLCKVYPWRRAHGASLAQLSTFVVGIVPATQLELPYVGGVAANSHSA